jgi:hypothetical protein
MGKRKFCYLQREAMKTVSAIALVTYAICASMPVSTTMTQVMLARILSGGTPIEEGNDACPIDWLLLLALSAGQAPTGLAIVAALLRIQVAKWAKGPYVGGKPTDFEPTIEGGAEVGPPPPPPPPPPSSSS